MRKGEAPNKDVKFLLKAPSFLENIFQRKYSVNKISRTIQTF